MCEETGGGDKAVYTDILQSDKLITTQGGTCSAGGSLPGARVREGAWLIEGSLTVLEGAETTTEGA